MRTNGAGRALGWETTHCNMMTLKGKTAVVTGGTRGIGYSVARLFLAEGASVAVCGSRRESADKAVAQLLAEQPGAPVMGLAPRLTDSAEVGAALDQVKARFGSLDILVNNAGISQSTPLADYTSASIDAILDLNVKAGIICCQAAAERMGPAGGVILFTSSVVSLYGQPSGCAYPASKCAVNGLTRSLARELAPRGIRVNAVAPGVVKTDMVAALPEDMIAPIVARIPLGRMADPSDIASAFLFLASPAAAYITGVVLPVDGGVMI